MIVVYSDEIYNVGKDKKNSIDKRAISVLISSQFK